MEKHTHPHYVLSLCGLLLLRLRLHNVQLLGPYVERPSGAHSRRWGRRARAGFASVLGPHPLSPYPPLSPAVLERGDPLEPHGRFVPPFLPTYAPVGLALRPPPPIA